MVEPINAQFALSAMSAIESITSNYATSATAAQNFAKLDLSNSNSLGFGAANDPTGTPVYLTSRLDTGGSPSGNFGVGVADIVVPIAFTRIASPDGPYSLLNIGVAPKDSDGVTACSAIYAPCATNLFDLGTTNATFDHVTLGSTEVRFGMLVMDDQSTTSSILDLHVPMRVQYWDGSAFVTNVDDQATTLSGANFHFLSGSETSYMHLSGSSRNMDDTHISLTGAILNGAFKNSTLDALLVAKPNPTIHGRGSANLYIDLSATGENKTYLCGKGTTYSCDYTHNTGIPSATVTFGSNNNVYRSRFIDLRENY
jgi:hypothetical protein